MVPGHRTTIAYGPRILRARPPIRVPAKRSPCSSPASRVLPAGTSSCATVPLPDRPTPTSRQPPTAVHFGSTTTTAPATTAASWVFRRGLRVQPLSRRRRSGTPGRHAAAASNPSRTHPAAPGRTWSHSASTGAVRTRPTPYSDSGGTIPQLRFQPPDA